MENRIFTNIKLYSYVLDFVKLDVEQSIEGDSPQAFGDILVVLMSAVELFGDLNPQIVWIVY